MREAGFLESWRRLERRFWRYCLRCARMAPSEMSSTSVSPPRDLATIRRSALMKCWSASPAPGSGPEPKRWSTCAFVGVLTVGDGDGAADGGQETRSPLSRFRSVPSRSESSVSDAGRATRSRRRC